MEYYLLKADGDHAGPYTLDQLKSMWASGQVTAATPFWCQGMAAWGSMRDIQHRLNSSRSGPPPELPTPPFQSGRMMVQPSYRAGISRNGIKVPVLISAIGNIVFGLAYACTCYGLILTVPMIILCIFEFSLYGEPDDMPPVALVSKARTLGVFEIILGLFNLISLVCGIIVLINASKLARSMQLA